MRQLPIELLLLAGLVSLGGRGQAQLDQVAKLPPASGKFGIGRASILTGSTRSDQNLYLVRQMHIAS
jgi:hypothetical protein